MISAAVSFAPLQLAPATIAGVLYAVRAHRLSERGKPVPGWRQTCFYAGLVVIVLALTALGDLAGEYRRLVRGVGVTGCDPLIDQVVA